MSVFCFYSMHALRSFGEKRIPSFCSLRNESCGCDNFCLFDRRLDPKDKTNTKILNDCRELYNRSREIGRTVCTHIGMCDNNQPEALPIEYAKLKCDQKCNGLYNFTEEKSNNSLIEKDFIIPSTQMSTSFYNIHSQIKTDYNNSNNSSLIKRFLPSILVFSIVAGISLGIFMYICIKRYNRSNYERNNSEINIGLQYMKSETSDLESDNEEDSSKYIQSSLV